MTDHDPNEFDRLRAESMAELDAADRASGIDPGLQPPRPTYAPPAPVPRRLVRDPNGKISGVASGLAAYLDVDVTLIRVGLVVLTFATGGLGLLLYIAASIIVPKAQVWPPPSTSPIEWRSALGEDRNAVALAVAAILALIVAFSGSAPTQIVLAIVLIGAGFWMLNERPTGGDSATGPAPTVGSVGHGTTGHVTQPGYGSQPGYSGQPGYPAVDGTTTSGAGTTPYYQPAGAGSGYWPPTSAPYPPVPTAVHRRRGPRPLRVLGALGLFVVAFAAIGLRSVDLSAGQVNLAPTDVASLPRTVEMGAGEVQLDLTNLTADELAVDAPHTIAIDMTFGEVALTLPDGVPIELNADVRLGEVTNGYVNPPSGVEPLVIIDVSMTAGEVTITRK